MSIPFTRYLTDFASGFVQGATNPKGVCANWRHATRLFVDDTFRLSPRHRFSFYVFFDINKNVLKDAPAYTNKIAQQEVGMLVKSADMPKVTFDTAVKNQYNRKKVVYTGYNYDPVTLKLHDDADGVTNALWAIYYGYYVADRHTAASTLPGDGTEISPAYKATHYKPTKDQSSNYRFGLDNNITDPFFNSITIYSMSRGRFLGYTLVNPRIKYWAHGTLDYAAGDHLDSTMQLEYESVIYTGGTVSQGTPKGFATLHYDNVPSPLSIQGGGTSTLGGPGGLLAGMETIFGNISNGSAFGSIGGLIGTAATAYNMVNNAKGMDLGKVAIQAGVQLAGNSIVNNVNANFPSSPFTTGVTTGMRAVVNKSNPNGGQI